SPRPPLNCDQPLYLIRPVPVESFCCSRQACACTRSARLEQVKPPRTKPAECFVVLESSFFPTKRQRIQSGHPEPDVEWQFRNGKPHLLDASVSHRIAVVLPAIGNMPLVYGLDKTVQFSDVGGTTAFIV